MRLALQFGFADADAKASAGNAALPEVPAARPTVASRSRASRASRPRTRCSRSPRPRRQPGGTSPRPRPRSTPATKVRNSALHALDDFADSGINAGQAAKLIILVARPLGLSTTAFNPDGDAPVNLQAIVDAGHQADGSYGAFNATLYAAIAKRASAASRRHGRVHPRRAGSRRRLELRRRPDRGRGAGRHRHHRARDPGAGACRFAGTDPDLRQGFAFLASQQQANGSWQSFGADDPNSTAVAMFAITAAGFDPTRRAGATWPAPTLSGPPYTSPVTWLRADQLPSGRFKSPNDEFGINTFAHVAVDPGAAARLAAGRTLTAADARSERSARSSTSSTVPARRRRAGSAVRPPRAAMPATSITNPRIAKATDRTTGACTSSPCGSAGGLDPGASLHLGAAGAGPAAADLRVLAGAGRARSGSPPAARRRWPRSAPASPRRRSSRRERTDRGPRCPAGTPVERGRATAARPCYNAHVRVIVARCSVTYEGVSGPAPRGEPPARAEGRRIDRGPLATRRPTSRSTG